MANRSLLAATPSQQQLGIAILRIVTGAVFAMHGGQKLFVYGFAGVTGAFTKMGIPMPGLMGPFIAVLEFFGGLALVIGLLTRLAALGLAFDMLGAILLVHLAGGFFLPAGYEFALTLFAASLGLVLAGPGALSLDAAIVSRRDHTAP
ncbi:MAG TPA: DoxX family protein [Gemmatimonadaceae bacterium]|nr:DoxX family protein [Gemmatimonadaceae bacterium]